jgi:hypothetical protein
VIAQPLRWILAGALCAWLLFAAMGGAGLSAHSAAPLPHQPDVIVPACDPITTDTTWTTGNIYVLQNCNLTIAADGYLAVSFDGDYCRSMHFHY